MRSAKGGMVSFFQGVGMTAYDTGAHMIFYHRYHIVCATKYRYKVLEGDLRRRIRDIIRQVCAELGVMIIKGVLSRDYVYLLVSTPPKRPVSDVVQRVRGRSSRSVQREFPSLGKRYWGRHFWAHGFFCATAGNITEDIVLQYLEKYGQDATGASR